MTKRHSVKQIVVKLRQAGVDLGQGRTVPKVCKQLDISHQVRNTQTTNTRTGYETEQKRRYAYCDMLRYCSS